MMVAAASSMTLPSRTGILPHTKAPRPRGLCTLVSPLLSFLFCPTFVMTHAGPSENAMPLAFLACHAQWDGVLAEKNRVFIIFSTSLKYRSFPIIYAHAPSQVQANHNSLGPRRGHFMTERLADVETQRSVSHSSLEPRFILLRGNHAGWHFSLSRCIYLSLQVEENQYGSSMTRPNKSTNHGTELGTKNVAR